MMNFGLLPQEITDLPTDMLVNPLRRSFDSETVSPSERLNYWCNHATKGNGLEIHCETNNFLARMTERDLGQVRLFGLDTVTPHRAVREQSMDDLCFINLQRANEGVFFRGDHEVSMSAGSMAIYEAKSGYELNVVGSSRSIVIALPKSTLEGEMLDFERHLHESVFYNSDLVDMLAIVSRKVLASDMSMKQSVVDGLGNMVWNLILTILYDSESQQSRPPSHGQAAILYRTKKYVRDNISDPEISPKSVAQKMNITVSYLHKVFRAEKTTLMQFVLGERLERCRCDLAKKSRTTNISQIAYDWGFNDASHFTRSFRKRFDVSPREYRQLVENNLPISN